MCTGYDTGVDVPWGPISVLETSNKAPSQVFSLLSVVSALSLYKSPNQFSSALQVVFTGFQGQWPEIYSISTAH